MTSVTKQILCTYGYYKYLLSFTWYILSANADGRQIEISHYSKLFIVELRRCFNWSIFLLWKISFRFPSILLRIEHPLYESHQWHILNTLFVNLSHLHLKKKVGYQNLILSNTLVLWMGGRLQEVRVLWKNSEMIWSKQ